MNKKILLLGLCLLSLFGCDRKEKMPSDFSDKYQISAIYGGNETRRGDIYSNREDQLLIQKIRKALRNDFLLSRAESRILLVASNGSIIIKGKVDREDRKNAISLRVKQIGGVKRIDNRLIITRDDEEVAQVDDPKIYLNRDTLDENAAANYPVNQPAMQAGDQYRSDMDRAMTREIRASIANDPSITGSLRHVQIVVSSGAVTLQGYVNSNNDKMQVEYRARQVRGVRNIDNRLQLRPEPDLYKRSQGF